MLWRLDRCYGQSVSQSVITTLLAGSIRPTRTLYSGLLSKCAAGISASSNADASSPFFCRYYGVAGFSGVAGFTAEKKNFMYTPEVS